MRLIEHKIDSSVKAYAKRWLKSLDIPRASGVLSNLLIGFSILFWSATITTLFGYDLKKGFGTLVFIGVWLFFTFGILLAIRVMSKLGIDRTMRSAFMLSAIVGPYINLVAYRAWNLPMLSHIAGFFASILAFLFGLLLDRLFAKAPQKAEKDQ